MSRLYYTRFTCTRCRNIEEDSGCNAYFPVGWRALKVGYLDGRDHFEVDIHLCPPCARSLNEWRNREVSA